MDGIVFNLGRIIDNIFLIEEVNFFYCNLFILEILENLLFRGFLIFCYLK